MGIGIYNATIAGCDRSCELRVGNLGTVYANLREGCCRQGGSAMRERGGRAEERGARGGLEREREDEGLYRYVPAAVVCNIMITLPACAPGVASLLHPAYSLPLSLSLSISLSLFLSIHLPFSLFYPLASLLRVYQAARRPPSFSGHVAGKYDYCYYLHPPSVVSS